MGFSIAFAIHSVDRSLEGISIALAMHSLDRYSLVKSRGVHSDDLFARLNSDAGQDARLRCLVCGRDNHTLGGRGACTTSTYCG